ncbi:MAG: molecular chaperone TorD family protein [Candidatus Omnitrophica bacterium]|nr:molecular chaperone TorD family protein [Candidatus Omnitrophota bacterium]
MTPRASTHQHDAAVAALQTRAGAYFLFARLFREAPSAALLQEIVHEQLLTCAEQCGAGCNGLSLDPAEDATWPQQVEAIAVEYARLFAVPGEQAVHPYESVYCDPLTIDASTACSAYFEPEPQPEGLTGFLYGPSTRSVSEVYQRAGFELNPSLHELPDHLAIELEFMGQLLARGAQDQARNFFTQHLGRWVFHCLDEIRQETQPTGFYRTVADALVAFLEHDQDGRSPATIPGGDR